MSSVHISKSGNVSAINNEVSRVGALLAIASLGLTFGLVFKFELNKRVNHNDLSERDKVSIISHYNKLLDLPLLMDCLNIKKARLKKSNE